MQTPPSFAGGVGSLIPADEWAYHYTTLEAAVEHILPTNTIRFSPLETMNDPKESNRSGRLSIFVPKGLTDIPAYIAFEQSVKKAVASCTKILCACIDQDPVQDQFDRGHFKPRMWAQYGARGRGICLVFRKSPLTNLIQHTFGVSVLSGKVTYTRDRSQLAAQELLSNDLNNLPEVIAKTWYQNSSEPLVFKKHSDWSSENEYRWSFFDETLGHSFLDFQETLAAIVVGPEFPDPYIPLVREAASTRRIHAFKIRWNATAATTQRLTMS